MHAALEVHMHLHFMHMSLQVFGDSHLLASAVVHAPWLHANMGPVPC